MHPRHYSRFLRWGLGLFAIAALAPDASASELLRPVRHHSPPYESYKLPEYFATIGAGAFDPSSQPGSGFYLTGSAGSVLAHKVDLGLQISWYHRSTGGGAEFVSSGTLPDGTVVQTSVEGNSVDTDLLPVMGVLRVRFPIAGSGIEPYVGAAAGWEWLTIEGIDNQGFVFHNDYDGFGAQFLAGMNLSVGPGASLYGEAVYNLSTVHAEFYDPFYDRVVREEADFDGIGLHGGLRLRF
jgi:hypothetical protein